MTLLREGSGQEIVTAICEASRALVFISVPWSAPERSARQVLHAAVAQLERTYPALSLACFRLEVDGDAASLEWLSSLGQSSLANAGAGSVLWLTSGRMLSVEITANALGVEGIVSKSLSLWDGPDKTP